MKKATKALKIKSVLLVLALLTSVFVLPVFAAEDPPGDGEASSAADGGDPDGGAGEEGDEGAGDLSAADFVPAAEGAIVLNGETGIAIYEKNADTKYTAASLVKVMTCILAMDAIDNLDTTQVAVEAWVADSLYLTGASLADFRTGETISARELLYGTFIHSGCDAALILAAYVSGSVDTFVYEMNTRAQQLGCTGTTFVDPHGLSEENVTTARDMALILAELSKYPELLEIAQADSYEVAVHEQHAESYYLSNTNRLIAPSSPYYTNFPTLAGAIRAGKTGSLSSGWQNFACYADKDGVSYYVVTLHSPDEADTLAAQIGAARYSPGMYEAARLLEWAYGNYTIRSVLDTTQAIDEVRVRYSSEDDAVKLVPESDLTTILHNDVPDSSISKVIDKPESVEAPVQQGQALGTVTVSFAGEEIGTVNLIAAKTVERDDTLYNLERFRDFLGTGWFKLIIAGVVVLILAYIVLAFWLNRRKKQRAAGNPYLQNGKKPKKRNKL